MRILYIIFLVGTFVSCGKFYKSPEVDNTLQVVSPPLLHVVSSRKETLGYIAEWYTGDFDNWKKIARFNDKKNSVIKLGESLFVPPDLVIREDSLDINSLIKAHSRYSNVKKKKISEEEKTKNTTPSSELTQEKEIQPNKHKKVSKEAAIEKEPSEEIEKSVSSLSEPEKKAVKKKLNENKVKEPESINTESKESENMIKDKIKTQNKEPEESSVKEEAPQKDPEKDPEKEAERIKLLHELLRQ